MFWYGVCAGPSEKFERIAQPAIRAVAPSAQVLVRRGETSIHTAYNALLDQARHVDGLEGLVLLHDDTSIEDAEIESKLRSLFADSRVGIVGVIGGRGHPRMAWWEQGARRGWVTDNQQGELDFGRGTHDVDTVDGLLMAFSPAAIAQLRFDERYPGFHGYDADICAQARALGLRVVVADIRVHHANNVDRWLGDAALFQAASLTYCLKWRSPTPVRAVAMRARRQLLVCVSAYRRWRG